MAYPQNSGAVPILTAAGHTRLILFVSFLALEGTGGSGPRPSDWLARLKAAREALDAFEEGEHRHLRHDLTDALCYASARHPGWDGWAWAHVQPGPTPPRRLNGLSMAGNGGPEQMTAVRADLVHALRLLGCAVEEGEPVPYGLPVLRHPATEAITAHRRIQGCARVHAALGR